MVNVMRGFKSPVSVKSSRNDGIVLRLKHDISRSKRFESSCAPFLILIVVSFFRLENHLPCPRLPSQSNLFRQPILI